MLYVCWVLGYICVEFSVICRWISMLYVSYMLGMLSYMLYVRWVPCYMCVDYMLYMHWVVCYMCGVVCYMFVELYVIGVLSSMLYICWVLCYIMCVEFYVFMFKVLCLEFCNALPVPV